MSMDGMNINEGEEVVVFTENDVVAGVVVRVSSDSCSMGVPRCGICVPVKREAIIDVRPLSRFGKHGRDLMGVLDRYGQESADSVLFAYEYYIEGLYED